VRRRTCKHSIVASTDDPLAYGAKSGVLLAMKPLEAISVLTEIAHGPDPLQVRSLPTFTTKSADFVAEVG
jgi:hypothetical protein